MPFATETGVGALIPVTVTGADVTVEPGDTSKADASEKASGTVSMRGGVTVKLKDELVLAGGFVPLPR